MRTNQTPHAERRLAHPLLFTVVAAVLAAATSGTPSSAAPKPSKASAAQSDSAAGTSSGPVAESGRSPAAAAAAATWEKLGLPHYEAPASYSEDLVIDAGGKTIVMKRAIDQGKTRTDLAMEGQNMVMIEMGDEPGTTYQLMPDRKEAMKQSRAAMNEMSGGKLEKAAAEGSKAPSTAPPPDMKVEDLGDDAVGGAAARKLRISSSEGDVLAWFEKATGAPLRMESKVEGKDAVIEWKNRKAGPQAASLFEVPKGYKVTDMDAMVAQMKGMGGMSGMAGGMVSGMSQGMGANLGSSLGASLGASLGGPLGAMAGQYIGGRIGGAIGKKVGQAVMPGGH